MNIIFLGTAEFAVASLEALLNSKHKVCGIITQPDRPAGRGMKVTASPIKEFAQNLQTPILQPKKVNTEEAYTFLQKLNPDILVVVAYGEFLGEQLLKFCKTPPVNVHPSLLPDLRGAAPMQWAVIRGYLETGVSIQFMAAKMDAGPVLLQKKVSIDENESTKMLSDRLKVIGADLLVEALNQIENGRGQPTTQDENKVTFAPVIKKDDGAIDWTKPAREIHNLIRGTQPWPGAFTMHGALRIKILKSSLPKLVDAPNKKLTPGEFCAFGDAMFVMTGDQWLKIEEIQPEGKRPMLPKDFMNGMKGKGEKFLFQSL